MKIILVKDVNKLGEAGKVVNVSDGYARNFLLPKNLALIATKNNLQRIEKIKKDAEIEKLEVENKFKAIAEKIKTTELTFIRKADENDHLFGSVSEIDIVEALAEKEIEINKTDVAMEKHLKEIGDFEVKIVFPNDIKEILKIKIEKE